VVIAPAAIAANAAVKFLEAASVGALFVGAVTFRSPMRSRAGAPPTQDCAHV